MRAPGFPTKRIQTYWVAGLLTLAIVSPILAQTSYRKKPVPAETAKPKKAHAAEASEEAPEKADTAAGIPGSAAKAKAKKPDEAVTPKRKAHPSKPPEDESDRPAVPAPTLKAFRSPTAPEKTKKPDPEPEAAPTANSAAIPNAVVAPETIVEFHGQPAGVRKLIESGLDLAGQNLTYTFGSADPANGGLDCSGFIYYVLRQHGLTQVPRDSSGLYVWARKAKGFRAVISRKPDSFEMDELLPGDLLFWMGTYATDHDPPVTHVMIYLGTEKSTGNKIMIGSSDGRSYHGQKRNGVSVFDFTMPRTPAAGDQRSTFIGYARIPGLRD